MCQAGAVGADERPLPPAASCDHPSTLAGGVRRLSAQLQAPCRQRCLVAAQPTRWRTIFSRTCCPGRRSLLRPTAGSGRRSKTTCSSAQRPLGRPPGRPQLPPLWRALPW